MGKYLVQVSYTPEAWAAMVKNPQSRLEAVRPGVESVGGTFDDAWLAFGQYDLIGICDFPDNVSAAAFSLSVAAKGAVKALHTTPLMTMDEGIQAMKKAGGSAYAPPS
ncbi:MAG: GYD domain-containing protein [Actinobacteria bacterium]|nr:GYD domain-containing protein [Actinomycetota bacterium]